MRYMVDSCSLISFIRCSTDLAFPTPQAARSMPASRRSSESCSVSLMSSCVRSCLRGVPCTTFRFASHSSSVNHAQWCCWVLVVAPTSDVEKTSAVTLCAKTFEQTHWDSSKKGHKETYRAKGLRARAPHLHAIAAINQSNLDAMDRVLALQLRQQAAESRLQVRKVSSAQLQASWPRHQASAGIASIINRGAGKGDTKQAGPRSQGMSSFPTVGYEMAAFVTARIWYVLMSIVNVLSASCSSS